MHSFTNPEADELGKKFGLSLAYNADGDKSSWEDMTNFFAEVLKNNVLNEYGRGMMLFRARVVSKGFHVSSCHLFIVPAQYWLNRVRKLHDKSFTL